jgi:hypothetical protein
MRRTLSLSLPEAYDVALRELARDRFEGNISAAVRWLMDEAGVTKSSLTVPEQAT